MGLAVIKGPDWTAMVTPVPPVNIHDQGRRHKVWPQIPKGTLPRAGMAEEVGNLEVTPKYGKKDDQGKGKKVDPAG